VNALVQYSRAAKHGIENTITELFALDY